MEQTPLIESFPLCVNCAFFHESECLQELETPLGVDECYIPSEFMEKDEDESE